MLCIDFTKADVAKGGKENILVFTDAFSKFSQAFVTSSQKSLVIAKLLVEKWFSIFSIPAQIHSDQGRSFDNEIISHLCKMYSIQQSTTTLYNPRGNTLCKWFNCTLFGLMRTLTEEQKPNWPVYLPSLVYAYDSTPHASTGFQPYELMFGHKAPMPCDGWLGLAHYKSDIFKSKTVWLNQQLSAMMHANKQVLKLISKSTQLNKHLTGGKELVIPVGNHVRLHDHLEGRNKIQNRYKFDIYVVVGHHDEPNIYYIQPLGSDKKVHPKVVNQCQLFYLNQSVPPSISSSSATDDLASVPSFLHSNPSGNFNSNLQSNINLDFNVNVDGTNGTQSYHYNTRSKHKATAASRQVVVEAIITYL